MKKMRGRKGEEGEGGGDMRKVRPEVSVSSEGDFTSSVYKSKKQDKAVPSQDLIS